MADFMCLSPFTMLLRLYLDQIRVDTRSEQLRTLLKTVVRQSQILRADASMTSLDSLVLSLQDFQDWKASGRVFEFVDHCILRVVRKPVHYYDILTDLITEAELDTNPRDCQVDLLLIAVMDQWRFMVKSADASTVRHVSKWLIRFIEVTNSGNNCVGNLRLRGETTRLLSKIRDHIQTEVQDTICHAMLDKSLEQRPELGISKDLVAANTTSEARHTSRHAVPPLKTHPKSPATILPPGPPEEHQDHPGLHQWTRYEVQDAISEGHIEGLILCLCSKHGEIRMQALTGVRALMMKLEVG